MSSNQFQIPSSFTSFSFPNFQSPTPIPQWNHNWSVLHPPLSPMNSFEFKPLSNANFPSATQPFPILSSIPAFTSRPSLAISHSVMNLGPSWPVSRNGLGLTSPSLSLVNPSPGRTIASFAPEPPPSKEIFRMAALTTSFSPTQKNTSLSTRPAFQTNFIHLDRTAPFDEGLIPNFICRKSVDEMRCNRKLDYISPICRPIFPQTDRLFMSNPFLELDGANRMAMQMSKIGAAFKTQRATMPTAAVSSLTSGGADLRESRFPSSGGLTRVKMIDRAINFFQKIQTAGAFTVLSEMDVSVSEKNEIIDQVKANQSLSRCKTKTDMTKLLTTPTGTNFTQLLVNPSLQTSISFTTPGIKNPRLCVQAIFGMNNTLSEAQAHAKYINQFLPGLSMDWVYNRTHTAPIDLLEIFGLNYNRYSPVTEKLLQRTWDKFVLQNADRPDAKLLVVCFSQGTIHVRNALMHSAPGIRDHIMVLEIAPAAVISSNLCYRCIPLASKRDIVPYGEILHGVMSLIIPTNPAPLFHAIWLNKDLVRLEPHPAASGMDHDIESPTFQKRIKNVITDYLEHNGEYK